MIEVNRNGSKDMTHDCQAFVGDGHYYFLQKFVVFDLYGKVTEDEVLRVGDEIHSTVKCILEFVRQLAFKNKQFMIAKLDYVEWALINGDLEDQIPFFYEHPKGIRRSTSIHKHYIDTVISFEDTQYVSSNIIIKHIYSDIYMNAIRSYYSSDYLNSLLYAGIACEIALITACNGEYMSAIEDHKAGRATRFNIIRPLAKVRRGVEG